MPPPDADADAVEHLLRQGQADVAVLMDQVRAEQGAVEDMVAESARLPIREPYFPPPAAVAVRHPARTWNPNPPRE